ncbi:MAG: recombinase family protein [Synergistaceae bacterium]|nr:recombinase family protein [Synergistaceae bacterium]
MSHNTYAYIRVSTQEQNETRQLDAIKPMNIDPQNVYLDKQSGKNFNRPAWKKLLCRMQRGDLLVVKSIDRLGRNYADVITQWRSLTCDKGIDIKVLDMSLLDTTYCKDLLGTFISDLVLQILSFAAQLERDFIRQRQAEGIAAAKAVGKRFGKRPLPLPPDFDDLFQRWRRGEFSSKKMAALCKISRRTLFDRTKTLRESCR